MLVWKYRWCDMERLVTCSCGCTVVDIDPTAYSWYHIEAHWCCLYLVCPDCGKKRSKEWLSDRRNTLYEEPEE